MQGVYWKETEIERSEMSKYRSTSQRSGKVYATIWYNGDNIDEEKTYSKR